jgi:glycosyltransferase involved in cell wall biosynthesis
MIEVTDVSVIIPAFNEAGLIAACVGSARAAIAPVRELRGGAVRCRVIVVDNNSSDDTARLARQAGADRVVFEPVNQIARARNAGASAAMERVGAGPSHWLVFVDADSRIGPGLVADMLEQASRGKCVGGSAFVRFDPPDTPLRRLEPVLDWVMRLSKMTAGAFIFCRADAFAAIGGYDMNLFAAEDAKIGVDLKRWGKARGLRMAILERHPVVTSARKVGLFRPHQWASLILRVMFRPGTLKGRDGLGFFYDGRR